MRVVLEDIIEAIKPRRKRFFTRERIVTAAGVAAQILSVVVLKRPGLAPLQAALTALLSPSRNPGDIPDDSQLVYKIREIRALLAEADEAEQVRLRAQLDLLVSMLVNGDGGPKEV